MNIIIAIPAAAITLIIRTKELCFCLLCKLLVKDDIISKLFRPSNNCLDSRIFVSASTRILLLIPSASFLWICERSVCCKSETLAGLVLPATIALLRELNKSEGTRRWTDEQ